MSTYSNIRTKEMLGPFIGQSLVLITQHDKEDYDPETKEGSFVCLMFSNGLSMTFPIGDHGFHFEHEDGCDCDTCKEGAD